MGDYTDYTDLEVIDTNTGDAARYMGLGWPTNPLLNGLFFDISENGWGDLNDHLQADPHKWYDHAADMEKLSLEYPDVVFVLYGTPEYADPTDTWRLVVRNGVSVRQHPRLDWPDMPVFPQGPVP